MTPTRSHGAPLAWLQSCGQLLHDSPASQRPLPHFASVVGGGGGGGGGLGGGDGGRLITGGDLGFGDAAAVARRHL